LPGRWWSDSRKVLSGEAGWRPCGCGKMGVVSTPFVGRYPLCAGSPEHSRSLATRNRAVGASSGLCYVCEIDCGVGVGGAVASGEDCEERPMKQTPALLVLAAALALAACSKEPTDPAPEASTPATPVVVPTPAVEDTPAIVEP